MRIIADFFELAGWDCDYIGANTPKAAALEMLLSRPPDLVAISATTSYHVREVAAVIEGMRTHPGLEHIPVLVGGRAFSITENLWRNVGADGWAIDARSAVARGAELIAGRPARE